MKLLTLFPALTAVVLLAQQSAEATVAIYTGTEVQLDHHGTQGMGHQSNGVVRLTGQVYFLYEIETGRSVEIRILGRNYKVRNERNFVYVRTPRAAWTANNSTVDTFLSDGSRVNEAAGAKVSLAWWEGSRTLSVTSPEKDPATGLPNIFPKALTSRQDAVALVTSGDRAEAHIRRVSRVVVAAPLTKASNVAAENFEAALERLKNALNARGLTEVSSLVPSLDE